MAVKFCDPVEQEGNNTVVVIDNRTSGCEATKRPIEEGWKKIAHITSSRK